MMTTRKFQMLLGPSRLPATDYDTPRTMIPIEKFFLTRNETFKVTGFRLFSPNPQSLRLVLLEIHMTAQLPELVLPIHGAPGDLFAGKLFEGELDLCRGGTVTFGVQNISMAEAWVEIYVEGWDLVPMPSDGPLLKRGSF